MERNYDFRRTLLQIHKPDLRESDAPPPDGELALDTNTYLCIPEGTGRVMRRAALDLQDYLFTSMGVSVRIRSYNRLDKLGPGNVIFTLKALNPVELGGGDFPRGYRIDCDDNAVITGYDENGAMQGGFMLEEMMSMRRAPYIKKGTRAHRPLFSPRMIHSGFAEDDFPDAHLAAIAHAGMDAILVTVTGINKNVHGMVVDFNELCYRAAEYGIDAYIYSYLPVMCHPDDPGAAAYYEHVFGAVFEHCPAFKGLVMVGEATEFPSKDERTNGNSVSSNSGLAAIGPDGLPTDKPSSGFFPCRDYPRWIELIRDTVRRHKSDADVVFWTYNWGCQPEDLRLEFIRNLPAGVTLLVTFEMFETFKTGNVTATCVDYTLMFPGPGHYFLSEAKAAKERGIRLYSMANTGGLTWDIGVIPYEPTPYQWMRRYEGILEARKKYGLCGLMESHHYGFWPSFISELAKSVYSSDSQPPGQTLRDIAARDFGSAQVDTVLNAWQLWSDGISHYRSTDEDQYGPFRIGPAYPLVLFRTVKMPDSPAYQPQPYENQDRGRCSLLSFRIHEEIDSLAIMRDEITKGADLLDGIMDAVPEKKRAEAQKMANLGRFMGLCAQTTINVKKWFIQKLKLMAVHNNAEAKEIIAAMRVIAQDEIENAREAIPLVRYDSRLGWEPRIGYQYLCDEKHLDWKIKQVNHVLEHELPIYEDSLSYN